MKLKKIVELILKEGTYFVDFELGKKNQYSGEQIFAGIHSGWQWEYDSDDRYAFLYFSWKTGEIRILIIERHEKTGIGKGVRMTNLVNEYVGTLKKPNFAKIQGLLKKHSHDRTRAGSPFGRTWLTPKNKELSLKDQIAAVNKYLVKVNKMPEM